MDNIEYWILSDGYGRAVKNSYEEVTVFCDNHRIDPMTGDKRTFEIIPTVRGNGGALFWPFPEDRKEQ